LLFKWELDKIVYDDELSTKKQFYDLKWIHVLKVMDIKVDGSYVSILQRITKQELQIVKDLEFHRGSLPIIGPICVDFLLATKR
jgi:hypothetical protein